MDARSIIELVKTKQSPTRDEFFWFAKGLANGAVSDAQAGAFAMAVRLCGLTDQARIDLALAMRDSGDRLHWDLPGPVLDKHSTGGVGDAVSLVLAPALAACGAFVPMISGRGLGHTGGTLDKLEAIPGLVTEQTGKAFRTIVAQTGCAIVAASADLAPADQRLYAIRDVTATVDSIDLITSSILAKKLAAGLQGLVLDVKFGSGAVLPDPAAARALAQTMVDVANGAGCASTAILSDMNQPVLNCIGNALEIRAVMACLRGSSDHPRMMELVEVLGAAVLEGTRLTAVNFGRDAIRDAIKSGAALARFGQMVTAMGGPADFVDHWDSHLPKAAVTLPLPAPRAGYLCAMNGTELGLAVVALGGGRHHQDDKIDMSVGLCDIAPLGAKLAKGDPLMTLHAADKTAAELAAKRIMAAITIGDMPPILPPLVVERIT